MTEATPCPRCKAPLPAERPSQCPQCGAALGGGGSQADASQAQLRAKARAAVRMPALGLLVVGVFGIAGNLFHLGWMLFSDCELATVRLPGGQESTLTILRPEQNALAIGMPILFLVAGVMITAGALQMLKLGSLRLARVGAWVALINFNLFCCLVGYPVGVWALMVLRNPDVQRAFAEAAVVSPPAKG